MSVVFFHARKITSFAGWVKLVSKFLRFYEPVLCISFHVTHLEFHYSIPTKIVKYITHNSDSLNFIDCAIAIIFFWVFSSILYSSFKSSPDPRGLSLKNIIASSIAFLALETAF